MHHVWGRYFFLPGINFFPMGKWHLPESDVKVLVLTIRRITRLLWTLLLDFQQVRSSNFSSQSWAMHVMSDLVSGY